METRIGAKSADGMRRAILDRLRYSVGKDPSHAVARDWCVALSLAVRDRLVDSWMESTQRTYAADAKRVYYLSLEYLIGRLLTDTIANLGLTDTVRQTLEGFGQDYGQVAGEEPDAALGNGGLGRLAACFLDSMATLGIPAYGYGLRYEHGLFRQRIENGWQVEEAEDWLMLGNPWEFERPEVRYTIGMGGHVDWVDGRPKWVPGEFLVASAYDTPVAGWQGRHVNTLRLWSAKPAKAFDLSRFNVGDYLAAAAPRVQAETITNVLYPDDHTPQGQELRLKQEYFFTAASVQDALRRFLQDHSDIGKLPEKVAIQMNDTHPAIAVPELIRVLMDEYGLPLNTAFDLTRRTCAYTNHTLLPEALEKWSIPLMERFLPRHMQIIRELDAGPVHHAINSTTGVDRAGVTIVQHGAYEAVRMGHLAFVGSHHVNGVSALHTELMKETVFGPLHRLFPDRIINQTNGVTPRRWMNEANPALSRLLKETIGEGWIDDLEQLRQIEPEAGDAGFRAAFAKAKRDNKVRLSNLLDRRLGVKLDPDALFDIQIKRIHEYKRQLLNIVETVALYHAIRDNPSAEWTPRVKIFAGKAFPSYVMAKIIIKLINDVANVVNNDAAVGDRLKVAYVPNYNVSLAERLIPAADLSEQISTAGMEASGTGNMKFALNGALTIGTLDGANVEMREHIGDDDIYIFGLKAHEVAARRSHGNDSRAVIEGDERLRRVLGAIAEGHFSADGQRPFGPILDALYNNDFFMVTADFAAYHDLQRQVDQDFRDRDAWVTSAVKNTARMGWFSSDRTIASYAADVWNVPVRQHLAQAAE